MKINMHGGYLVYKFFFILIILMPLNSMALELNDTLEISNKDLDKFILNKQFYISKREKKIAHNLTTIFDIAQKGYTNSKITKSLLKDAKKSKPYYIYIDWLRNILKVDTAKKVTQLRAQCSKLIEKDNKNFIKDILNENAKNLCIKRYLRLLTKVPSKSTKHFKEFDFVHGNISTFLSKDNNSSFKYFISQLKRDSYSHKEYSKFLTQYYIKNDLSPEKDLVQYVRITPDFTRFIQIKGVEDNTTNYLFHKELEGLIKKSYLAAENKKDKSQVLSLTKKAINYYNLSQDYLPKSRSKRHVKSLGKSLLRRHYYKSAHKVYDSLLKNYPNEEDLVFEKLWAYLTKEEYSEAYQNVIKPLRLDKNYKNIKDERLQFWTALTLKEVYKSKYKRVFENLISKSPLNYYSILSSKLLADKYEMSTNEIFYKFAYDKDLALKRLPNLDKYTIRSLKRLKIWGEMDFKPFIRMELANLQNVHAVEIGRINKTNVSVKNAKTALTLLSMRILHNANNHLESFKVVYRGFNRRILPLDKTVLDNLFPKPFYSNLKKYKRTFDPIIALSLIRQESGFNKRALSHAGARGLMQLMPATARRFQRVRKHQLYYPNLNLKIGSKYLDILYKRYEKNLVYTLSAYNAGGTRVKRWKKRYLTNDSIVHNIENIPFYETRKYVKLIFRNIFFYKMLDKNEKLIDSHETNKIFDVYLGFNSLEQ